MDPANDKCSRNITGIGGFLLLGFQTEFPELKKFLFFLFFTIYLFTIAGNILIVITVSVRDVLHAPMYFFLGNLSFIEICYTTNIVPLILNGFLVGGSIISFSACLAQLCIFGWMAAAECFLLTVMAYDRYLAICYPLHYTNLMDTRQCCKMTTSSWVAGLVSPSVAIVLLVTVKFPRYHEIDHFFCDFEPILQAACSDTSLIRTTVSISSFIVTSIPFLLIIVSYIYIIVTIMRIPSRTGRHKAFSTCSSHLTVVITYFGTLITIYVAPTAGKSISVNKALSLLYTVATPLLNPIIYTLRNQEIREACGNLISKMF